MNVVGSSSASKTSGGRRRLQSGDASLSSTAVAVPLLNVYDEPPRTELSLDEFETFALKRLKVLRTIEQWRLRRGVSMADMNSAIKTVLEKEELQSADSTRAAYIDHVSHFILRLSYCQTEELRRWFLTHECALFQHRLWQFRDDPQQLAHAVRSYSAFQPMSRADKERFRAPLTQLLLVIQGTSSASSMSQKTTVPSFEGTTFYAVPFTQALDLIASRQCFLHGGLAYVPQPRVISLLVAKFRMHLSLSLTYMGAAAAPFHAPSNGVSADPEQARIYPLLRNMNQLHPLTSTDLGQEGIPTSQQMTAANVPNFVGHMPLCMRLLHTGMQRDHKLKHHGRLQYGLFLKGAGLSMDDAMVFFQRHFTAVTSDGFAKTYAYGIRHMYGQEGKRANYTPYPCSKIILGPAPASTGDHHGCPYKHYDTEHLNKLLQQLQIGKNGEDRRRILQLKKDNQFQLACNLHFELAHPGAAELANANQKEAINSDGANPKPILSLNNVGNHPNAWFRASVMYDEVKKYDQLQQQPSQPNSSMDDMMDMDAGSSSFTTTTHIPTPKSNMLRTRVSP